jgi:hypothetical protein
LPRCHANRELEIRMKVDEERIKKAFEEREKLNNEAITSLSDRLMELTKQMAELRKEKK